MNCLRRQTTALLSVSIVIALGVSARYSSATHRLNVATVPPVAAVDMGHNPRTPATSTYSCGGATGSSHCLASIKFDGHTEGAATTVDVVHLSCPPSSCYDNNAHAESGFVDNEEWLYDFNNNSCVAPTDGSHTCWVEAGYSTYANSSSSATTNYFWADVRPSQGIAFGSNYNLHVLGQVPSGDYGQKVNIMIYNGAAGVCIAPPSPPYGGCLPVRTDEYFALIQSPNYRSLNLSEDNAMVPNAIDVGQELAGAGGASAPTAHFTGTSFGQFGSLGVTFVPEGADGIPLVSYPQADNYGPPPTVGYTTPPSSAPGTGGNLYTNCC